MELVEIISLNCSIVRILIVIFKTQDEIRKRRRSRSNTNKKNSEDEPGTSVMSNYCLGFLNKFIFLRLYKQKKIEKKKASSNNDDEEDEEVRKRSNPIIQPITLLFKLKMATGFGSTLTHSNACYSFVILILSLSVIHCPYMLYLLCPHDVKTSASKNQIKELG